MSTIDKKLEKRLAAIEARLDAHEELLKAKPAKKASTRTPGLINSLRMYIEHEKEQGVGHNDAKAAWKDLDDDTKAEWAAKAKKYNEGVKNKARGGGDDDDDESASAPPAKKSAKSPAKKSAPVAATDDSDDAPKPKAGRKTATKKSAPAATADSDEEPPKPKAGRKTASKKPVVADSDDDDAPPVKKAAPAAGSDSASDKPAPKKRAPGNKAKGAIKAAALSDDS